jgi:Leucine-rich repeat (LRR) protein
VYLTNLRELNLNCCDTRFLKPHSSFLTNFPNLQTLTIHHKHSIFFAGGGRNFPSSFFKSPTPPCHQLVELDLAENGLDSLDPGMFETLSGLRSLDLSNNLIASLRGDGGEVFKGLFSLEELNLSGNRLRKIGEGDLKALSPILMRKLVLVNNPLEYIEPGEIERLVNLEDFKFDGNRLVKTNLDKLLWIKWAKVLKLESVEES